MVWIGNCQDSLLPVIADTVISLTEVYIHCATYKKAGKILKAANRTLPPPKFGTNFEKWFCVRFR